MKQNEKNKCFEIVNTYKRRKKNTELWLSLPMNCRNNECFLPLGHQFNRTVSHCTYLYTVSNDKGNVVIAIYLFSILFYRSTLVIYLYCRIAAHPTREMLMLTLLDHKEKWG